MSPEDFCDFLYRQMCADFVEAHEFAYNRIDGKSCGRVNLQFGGYVAPVGHHCVDRDIHFGSDFFVAKYFHDAYHNLLLALA